MGCSYSRPTTQDYLVLRGDDVNTIGWLETHHAVFKGEQGEIPALAHEKTGLKPGAFLPDNDASGFDELAAEALHPEPLRIGIAAVFGTS